MNHTSQCLFRTDTINTVTAYPISRCCSTCCTLWLSSAWPGSHYAYLACAPQVQFLIPLAKPSLMKLPVTALAITTAKTCMFTLATDWKLLPRLWPFSALKASPCQFCLANTVSQTLICPQFRQGKPSLVPHCFCLLGCEWPRMHSKWLMEDVCAVQPVGLAYLRVWSERAGSSCSSHCVLCAPTTEGTGHGLCCRSAN